MNNEELWQKNSTVDLQTSSYSHLEQTSEKEQMYCMNYSPTVQINPHLISQYSLNEATYGRER
jgi:hypothetical protein